MDKNLFAVSVFDKLAQSYQDKFMDVSMYKSSLDQFCTSLDKNQLNILELACGPGNITRYLLNQRPHLNILATDLSPNMLELAKINNPEARFQILDCKQIGTLTERYHGIVCGFCFPYLPKEDCEQLISDAAKLLAPGGLLYLSVIEDEYERSQFKKGSGGDEIFMHYYPAHYLEPLLISNNFSILHTDRITYQHHSETTTDLTIIAKIKNS